MGFFYFVNTMQYSLYINQLFIASHPQCQNLDLIDAAIFDCIRKLLSSKWGTKKHENNDYWTNISVSKISQEMPLLRDGKGNKFKARAIHGRIAKLCEAGLLKKREGNQKLSVSFIAIGDLAEEYDSYDQPLHINANPIAYKCNGPLHLDANNKNTIQNTSNDIPLTPLDNGSASEPPKPAPRVKKKLTRAETQDFYDKQMTLFDDFKIPKELEGGAAARGIKPAHITGAYTELIDYMTKPSDKWPDGMWGCVLTKTHQLSLDQFCKLVLKLGMKRDAIKAYLDTWENKKYDNGSIYATFCDWWSREKPSPQNEGKVKVSIITGEFNK